MSDLPVADIRDTYAMHPTDKGLALLTKIIARGFPLRFTRAAAGDGYLPEDADPYKVEDLVNRVIDLPICSKVDGGGVAVVRCYQTSKGLAEPYVSREIGLYAEDPDEGEILYAYHNAGDRPDFIPAENSPVVTDWILALVTIIGRAPVVEAVIDTNFAFVTHEEVEYKIDSIFAQAAAIDYFWTKSAGDGNLLRPSTLDQVKQAILGVTDIESLNRRVERLEDAVAQILLELEVREIYPDYSHWILEDFRVVNQVDLYMCKVTSVVAGDDSLDCEPVVGLIPGSFYTITDGISHELVQAKHVAAENGIQRLILAAPVQNTYRLDTTYLYRTSATIGDGYAMGPTGKKNISWSTGVWKGQAAEEEYLIPLETTVGNSGSLEISGDIQITADGFLTLGGE